MGGVWNATPEDIEDKDFTIPQTRPSVAPKNPIRRVGLEGTGGQIQFLSPIYDDLETNIPHTLMKYSDLPFPEGTPLFPSHEEVLKYLERYADDLRHLISFGIQVLHVRAFKGEGKIRWSVTTRNLSTSSESTSVFDAVIVASGHYDDSYVPDIPGIKEWNVTYPGSISHSKFYRRPDTYKKKVTSLPQILSIFLNG